MFFNSLRAKKRKYYLRRLDAIQCMIWDAEFKREKTFMIREEVRKEYDSARAKMDLLTQKIHSQLKDPKKICEIHNPEEGKEKVLLAKGTCACEYNDTHMDIPDVERLYDERELLTRDAERYVLQMHQMDIDVNGSGKTNEYPDGINGLKQELDSLRELQGMLRVEYKRI